MRKITSYFLILAMMAGLVPPAFADDAELINRVSQMQKQMMDMQKTIDRQNLKIDQLENRSLGLESAPAPEYIVPAQMSDKEFESKLDGATGGANKWLKDLKFSGDMRLRYEGVDYHSGEPRASDNYNRFRFRLRYGFEKKFDPDMKVGFRLSSGQTTDPTSTNQTLDGNFADKQHVIDQAYAIYSPSWFKYGPIEKAEFGGGKFANPFTRGSTDMIWDGDVNPEGAYEMIDARFIDQENFGLKGYALAGQLILNQETPNHGTSSATLWAYQAGLMPELKIGDMPLKFTNAVSFYDYSGFAKNSNFGTLAGGNANVSGSSAELDAHQFGVLEIYNAMEFRPFDNLPVFKPYFDYARNLREKAPARSAGEENQAWALGLKIGSAKKKGQWEAGYAYKYIETNSVVGAFNDSDFGHSGRRGSVFNLGYALTDNLTLGLTGFFTNNLNHDSLTYDQNERRLMVDLVWKF